MTLKNCESQTGYEFSVIQLTVIVILSIMTAWTVIASIIDSWKEDNGSKDASNAIEEPAVMKSNDEHWYDFLVTSFSMARNFHVIGSDTSDTLILSLAPVEGMRFVTVLWIVLINTYGTNEMHFAFAKYFSDIPESSVAVAVLYTPLAYDTLLLIAALLSTKSVLDGISERKGAGNLLRIILERVLNLSTGIWLAVGLVFLIPAIASGPLWPLVFERELAKCSNHNWLYTGLFLNNWLPESHQCAPETWYFAVEVQMFLLSLFLVILLSWFA